MNAQVTAVSCTMTPSDLSNLMACQGNFYFEECGCLVNTDGASSVVGTDPYDTVDLIIDKCGSLVAAAQEILSWAKYWAEERKQLDKSRR